MARTVQRLRELDELDPQLGPQEALVFECIPAGEAIPRDEALNELTAQLEASEYAGNQTPDAMLGYYIAALQKRRLVSMEGKAEPGTRNTRTKNNLFIRLREVDELDTKLSPMEEMLFDLIGADGILRSDLIAAVQELKDTETIATKQDATQVVSLYHRDLMNRRLISVEDPDAVEAEEED